MPSSSHGERKKCGARTFHFKESGNPSSIKSYNMATLTISPNELLPAAKASGRCPPSLIRDEVIIEGGALIILIMINIKSILITILVDFFYGRNLCCVSYQFLFIRPTYTLTISFSTLLRLMIIVALLYFTITNQAYSKWPC